MRYVHGIKERRERNLRRDVDNSGDLSGLAIHLLKNLYYYEGDLDLLILARNNPAMIR